MTAREMQVSIMEKCMMELKLDNPDIIPTSNIFDTLNRIQYETYLRLISNKEDNLIEFDFRNYFTEKFLLRNPILQSDSKSYTFKMPNFLLSGSFHTVEAQNDIGLVDLRMECTDGRYSEELKVGDKLISKDGIFMGVVVQESETFTGGEYIIFKSNYTISQYNNIDTSEVYVGYEVFKYKDAKLDVTSKGCTYKHRPVRLISLDNHGHLLNDAFQGTHPQSPVATMPSRNELTVFFKDNDNIGEGFLWYIRKPRPISLVLNSSDTRRDAIKSQDCELPELYHFQIVEQAAREMVSFLRSGSENKNIKT